MKIRKGEIVIFKAAPEDSETEDSYKKTLSEAGYLTQNISVLEFEYCQLDVLEKHLQNPQEFSGLIFTSPRGVKAMTLIQDASDLLRMWQDLPVFVVGEETGRILKKELDLDGRGSSAGNASALADIVLKESYDKPFLFPCGNLKRDVLPTKLSDGGINLISVTVYQTKMHHLLEQSLIDILRSSSFPEMVVYFSPSGVKFTLPILQRLEVPIRQLKLVAIGPTTEEALAEHGLKVSAVASKPTPEHLLDAVSML